MQRCTTNPDSLYQTDRVLLCFSFEIVVCGRGCEFYVSRDGVSGICRYGHRIKYVYCSGWLMERQVLLMAVLCVYLPESCVKSPTRTTRPEQHQRCRGQATRSESDTRHQPYTAIPRPQRFVCPGPTYLSYTVLNAVIHSTGRILEFGARAVAGSIKSHAPAVTYCVLCSCSYLV